MTASRPLRSRAIRNNLCLAAALLGLLGVLPAQVDPLLRQPLDESGITQAAVQARIDATARLAGDEAAARKDLENAYKDALATVGKLEAARSRSTRFQAVQTNAPQQAIVERSARFEPIDRSSLRWLTTADIGTQLTQARAALEAAKRSITELDKETGEVTSRLKSLPALVADAELAVRNQEAALLATPADQPDTLRGTAQRTLAAARVALAKAERDALQAELAAAQPALDLAAARKQRRTAEIRNQTELVQALQSIAEQREQSEAGQMVTRAQEQLDELQTRNPVLLAAARDRLAFARRRVAVQQELPGLRARVDETKTRHADTKTRFRAVRDLIVHVGLTQTSGDVLRQHKARLPDLSGDRIRTRKDRERSGDIRVQQVRIAELLALDEDRFVALAAAEEPAAGDPAFGPLAREVYRGRAEVLARLQQDFDDQLGALAELETQLLLLNRLTGEFEAFIDEKILWVRSTDPIWSAPFARLPEVLRAMPEPGEFALALTESLGSNATQVSALVLLLVILVLLRRRLRRILAALGTAAEQPTSVHFAPTLWALGISLLLAAPLATLLWALGVVCRGIEVIEVAGSGPGHACLTGAGFGLAIETVRRICAPGGVATAHLGWSATTANRLRSFAAKALFVGMPTLLVVGTADTAGLLSRSLISRPVFLIGWLLMAFLLARLFRPNRSILSDSTDDTDSTTVHRPQRSHYFAFVLTIGLPLALTALAAFGYYFTAAKLSTRLLSSLVLLFGLVLANGVVNRWQLVTRRRLTLKQRRERLEAARAAAAASGETTTGQPPSEERLNVAEVSAQARRLTRTAFAVVGLVSVYGIWAEVMPALGGLREFDVWYTTETVPGPDLPNDGGKSTIERVVPISMADVLSCLIYVVLTVVAARNVPGLLKLSVLQRVRQGNQYAIATLVQYGIVIVGVVLAFGAIGVGWAKIQWLIAAVSLGLGFGLQEIFANFVSGLIILFERPIRVGDFVTVGDIKGEVTRIRIRATTIRNLDRQELIVPNKEFITGQVINWTLTDSVVRMVIHVGIAYGSDVQLAQRTLLRVADENPYVIDSPHPKALFKEFGDSALIFELRIFIRDMDHWPKALDSIHQAIDREFRKAGIEISFPQRDLHLRTADATLRIEPRTDAAPDAG